MALTVAVFRKSRHVLNSRELPLEDLLKRFKETVRCPSRKFVERYEVVAFLSRRQCTAGPNVPERHSLQFIALWPNCLQTIDQNMPQC